MIDKDRGGKRKWESAVYLSYLSLFLSLSFLSALTFLYEQSDDSIAVKDEVASIRLFVSYDGQ